MALVVASITIPKNTAAPLLTELNVYKRYVGQIQILYPDNAAYLVGVAIWNQTQQIAPAQGSNTKWIRDVGRLVTWQEQHDLGGSPRTLRIYAINEDDTYTRQVEVRIEVLDFATWAQLFDRRAG